MFYTNKKLFEKFCKIHNKISTLESLLNNVTGLQPKALLKE